MKFNFIYKESIPSYKEYNKLLHEMENMSKNFYSLDNIFFSKYDYRSMKKYEQNKRKIIRKMFDIIISYFPSLKNNPCSIYLNGSYARGNITAGSDIDLTFYFSKKEWKKKQPTIYLIRYAIATMLRVNVVHVHSFTKNFITEYRIKNNLVVQDYDLKTKIIWPSTNEYISIYYPSNQMILEREICEISSIKNVLDLKNLYKKQLKKLHPKEWIYTHKAIFITDNSYSIENLIKNLDNNYNKKEVIDALTNIKTEINELIIITSEYYNKLNVANKIELAKYNMIGKRKVCMLIHAFTTYLRWYYIYNELKDIPITLDLDQLFNYETKIINKKIIDNINLSYCYFRYLISKIEIWAKKYNHHYEHRSNEIISKNQFFSEYKQLWNNNYSPIIEQTKTYNKMRDNISLFIKYYNLK